MKKYLYLCLLFILSVVMSLAGCGGGSKHITKYFAYVANL